MFRVKANATMTYCLRPRKISSVNYSFFVSLPLDWIAFHNLAKGNFVAMEVDEKHQLVLKPNEEATKTDKTK